MVGRAAGDVRYANDAVERGLRSCRLAERECTEVDEGKLARNRIG